MLSTSPPLSLSLSHTNLHTSHDSHDPGLDIGQTVPNMQHQDLIQTPRQIHGSALRKDVPVLRVRLEKLLLLQQPLSDGQLVIDVLLRPVHHSHVATV